MFDQYVKLFDISWIETWMVEALAIMGGALLAALIVGKATDCFFNGDR